MDFLVCTD